MFESLFTTHDTLCWKKIKKKEKRIWMEWELRLKIQKLSYFSILTVWFFNVHLSICPVFLLPRVYVVCSYLLWFMFYALLVFESIFPPELYYSVLFLMIVHCRNCCLLLFSLPPKKKFLQWLFKYVWEFVSVRLSFSFFFLFFCPPFLSWFLPC